MRLHYSIFNFLFYLLKEGTTSTRYGFKIAISKA